jgi:serine/threonine-protein kinase
LLPETASLASGVASLGFDSTLIALSPGGNWLVYVGRSETGSLLYRQQTDEFEAPEAILGTDGAIHAFFSPDGESIGFLTNDRIKSVSLEGGDVQTIATTRAPLRGIWTEGDWLYVIDDEGYSIKRVHASGGEVEAVVEWSEVSFSDILPNRTSALASSSIQSINSDHAALVLVDLETGNSRPLDINGYDARWIPTGHLLFGRNGNVYVVRFDLQRGVVEGEPQPVLQGAAMDSLFGVMQISASASGALAFVPGADRGIGRLVAVDRKNVERALASAPQKYGALDLNTDDRLLAVHMADVKDYVSVYDLERQEGRKVVGSSGYGFPKFSPDRSLAFTLASSPDETTVMIGSTDGAAPRLVYESSESHGVISDWSPAGDMLTISNWPPRGVGLLAVDGQAAIQWLTDKTGDWGAVFSPDGQWLAYDSDETGRSEIWVLSIANPGLRRQLSVNGGIEPVWCPCGKVFFRRGDQFWASTVSLDTELDIGPEELQFTVRDFLDTPGRSYDVSSDGQTLFTVRRAEPTIEGRLHIMSNWLKDLERQVPVGER